MDVPSSGEPTAWAWASGDRAAWRAHRPGRSLAQHLGRQLVPALVVLALCVVLGGGSAFAAQPGTVDLNTATVEELCALPGVGPKKAEAILELRKKRPFTRVTQLLEVRGIGKKTLERLKAYVRIAGRADRALPAAGLSPAPASRSSPGT